MTRLKNRFCFVSLLVLSAGLAAGWSDGVTAETSNTAASEPASSTKTNPTSQRAAFSQPTSQLSPEQKLDFALGKALFKRPWVAAPASTQAADGLGPLYNARSCIACHRHNGRGRPTRADGQTDVSLILRLNGPNSGQAEPNYGQQLQTFAVPGLQAEGRIKINYEAFDIILGDGETVSLRKPTYRITDLSQGPLQPGTQTSPRIAPSLIGMGLLEAISDSDLETLADPDDHNKDGISGRINRVWSPESQQHRPGRFGWKAGMASVNAQVQNAFATDLGLSTPLHPDASGDCTPQQTECLNAPHGNSPQFENLEAHSGIVRWTTHYTRHLAVPQSTQRDDPAISRGARLFKQTGCAACHQPQFRTGTHADPTLSQRLIRPYTDLLLHDMGEGLADHRPEGQADGREWRTAPLWGIGLNPSVNGNGYYLHDGRARSLLEAILWHGGEAESAKNKVVALSKSERSDLLRFIESL